MQSRSLELDRIREELLMVEGVLHLRVRELDENAVLNRTHGDHPLPLIGAGTGNSRSVFLNGHLQPEDNCRLVLVEYGHKASAVDDRDLSIEYVRHIARLPVDRPDACRGDLAGKILFPLLSREPLLRKVCPVGFLIVLGRRPDMQCIWFQSRVEPPLIALIRIAPSAKLGGSSRVSFVGPVRDP